MTAGFDPPGGDPQRAPSGRRPGRVVAIGSIVALVVVAFAIGLDITGVAPFGRGGSLLAPPAGAAPASPGTTAVPAPPLSSSPPPTQAFASVRGIELHLPAAAERIVEIGYHEASFPVALALAPLGTCVRDLNRTKFAKPRPTSGPDYIVMSSRGRGRPATSAADVAMRRGTTVLAPTTGVVTGAKPYRLYGRYRDVRISIRPDGIAGVEVVVIHVDHVQVHKGDRVLSGVTAIGVPRVFPFSSQVNDYIGPGIPHVHIEVNRLGPARHETSD
jgi:murein DD-endopeptidase MepM/ murein hydrolase activator NlpD